MKPLNKTRKPVRRSCPPPRRQDDKFLKAAFEEWFPALLRFFYADANQIFDFDREIEFLDKELRRIQQIENFAHFLTHFIYLQDKKENRMFHRNV